MSNTITEHRYMACGEFPLRELSFSPIQNSSFSHGNYLRHLLVLLLMMTVGVMGVWGQTVSDGLYYIASGGNDGTFNHIVYNSNTPTTNFYLCPTENWYYYKSSSPYYQNSPDNGMPFMTTYQCLNDNNYDSKKALWCIKKKGDTDYYYIIHVVSGKYLTYNDAYFSNTGRVRVHLEDYSSAKDDYTLFKIEYVSQFSSYDIISKYAEDNNKYPDSGRPRKYLNVNKGNRQSLEGTDADKTTPAYSGGIIGLWTFGAYYEPNTDKNDQNCRWQPESTLLTAPTISDVSATNTISITDANSLPAGYIIRYTTGDGTQDAPTATTGYVYSDPIEVTSSMTIKAVVVRYDIVLTNVATKTVVPTIAIEAPMVTNNFDGTISLSTTTPNAKIYYTTDDTTPSSSNGTLYSSAFSLGDATVIKAIAYNSDLSESSTVTTYNVPQYDAPTISFNSSTSLVTIHSGSGGTVYYTTDGGTPTTSSTAYSAPFSVTSNTVLKAIATHAGYLASETATQTIITEPSFQYKTGFSYVYDGTEKEPIDHLEYSSTTIPSTAYLLTYTNNKNVGTATVTITDSGADDGFIVYGSTTFTITAATLSVTAEAKSKGFGDVDPELTYTYSGLVGGEDISDNLTGVLVREAGDNVGTYAINIGTLACSSGNYSINFTGANFTITQKNLGSGSTPASNITCDVTQTGETYSIVVKQGGKNLTLGTDYTKSGESNNDKYYQVTVAGTGNYTGGFSVKLAKIQLSKLAGSSVPGGAALFVSNSGDGNFAVPDNMTAHIVTGINGNTLVTEALDNIPQQVPVLLLSTIDANGFLVNSTTGTSPSGTNKLEVRATDWENIPAATVYMLYKGEFVLNAAGTLPAGKIYLPKPTGVSPAPTHLGIVWEQSTGIEGDSQFIIHNAQLNDVWYTLDGRRLYGKPVKKGLYLCNGEKRVVR